MCVAFPNLSYDLVRYPLNVFIYLVKRSKFHSFQAIFSSSKDIITYQLLAIFCVPYFYHQLVNHF